MSSFSSSSMVITREEFNTFHKIDRTLFTRLIFGLNKDINLSFQVMGFLLLLEQTFGSSSNDRRLKNLVAYLIKLPDSFINTLVNEINVCLSCLYHQDFSSFFISNNNDTNTIPLLLNLTRGNLTLKYIHQNRKNFLSDLKYYLDNICNRALDDIRVKAEGYSTKMMLHLEKENSMEESVTKKMNTLSVEQETSFRLSVEQESSIVSLSPPSGVEAVAADDRTVFLTFSKGYPIPEEEVEGFFKKRFGEEVIETIEMQEVEGNEQPLYAKMVLRSAWKIDEIVSAKGKNKFTIDGKHVCARKYVSKNASSAS